jgi:ferritin heavy chain
MAQQSQLRQNFSSEVEAAINKQVNIELYASYVYLSMSYYFDRDDVALPNIAKWLKKQSDEEREHAQNLLKYQNTRGIFQYHRVRAQPKSRVLRGWPNGRAEPP